MENKNLLILGAGQYGQVAKEIAESMRSFEMINFLDDNSENAIGKISDYENFANNYTFAIVAMGNADLRLLYIQELKKAGFRIASLVSPRADVSSSAKIMEGCVVEPLTVVNAHGFVGTGALVCAGAVVNHNAVVGEACQLDCGSVVEANAVMRPKTKLGCNKVFNREGNESHK